MNIIQGIRTLLHEVDEAVFPSNIYCLCCGSLIDESRLYSICDFCMERMHWITGPTCARCGKALRPRTGGEEDGSAAAADGAAGSAAAADGSPGAGGRLCYDCLRSEHLFLRGFSCVTYGLHEREIMMDLKYGGMGYIAAKCGDMMFDRMEGEIRFGLLSPGRHPVDLVVPVPVSEERLRRRGYNQSAWMARQLVRRWQAFAREEGEELPSPAERSTGGCGRTGAGKDTRCHAPVLLDALERAKATKMLRSLSPAERALELRDAFRVKASFRGRLAGKGILLIDDIYTTGATADACSRALLEGGASEVILLAWASGGNRRPTE